MTREIRATVQALCILSMLLGGGVGYITTLPGCAALKQYAIDVAKCEVGQVPTAIIGLVDDAEKILIAGGPDHGQKLDTLGEDVGIHAAAASIRCAVQAAVYLIEHPPEGHALRAVDPKVAAEAAMRGRAWLAGKK